MNKLKVWDWSLGFGETYLCASSLAIVAAATPFLVNVLGDATRLRVSLFSSPEKRADVLAKIAAEARA